MVRGFSLFFFCAVECFGDHGRQEGALCSVSVDRLDYDCLTGGVDVCVSSLMSAPQPSLFMLLPLWATQLQAGPYFVDTNPADTLVLHSQLIKLQIDSCSSGFSLLWAAFYRVNMVCMIGAQQHFKIIHIRLWFVGFFSSLKISQCATKRSDVHICTVCVLKSP